MGADLTGQRFGRLTIAAHSHRDEWYNHYWLCICDCGTQTTVRRDHLASGRTKSCGCLIKEWAAAAHATHGYRRGGARPTEYSIWESMRKRCFNPNTARFADYGGRGITICDRWRFGEDGLTGFECFLADMGHRPSSKHSIDRWPDNDGNYEPNNCRWATPLEQRHNRRPRREPVQVVEQ